MGAYYQNQVISKDKKTGEEFTFVQQGSFLKFMETQYAQNITMINVVRELSNKTSKDNPAKVYCVCDYDKPDDEYDNDTKTWLHQHGKYSPDGTDSKAVQTTQDEDGTVEEDLIENSRFLKPAVSLEPVEDVKVDGLFSGFVICKDTKEYLDIEQIDEIADITYDEHKGLVVSPIALLTRKSEHSQGGGDISDIEYAKCLDDYITKWYGKDIYWSSERPSDNFTDITLDTLVVEKAIDEKVANKDGIERIITYYHLVPVFGTEHSPYANPKN